MSHLLLCVLLSLVNSGLCLNCIICNSIATNCSGVLEACPPGKLCASTITQTTSANGMTTQTFERNCGDVNQCNTSASMSSFLTTETNSMCCNKDSCTPPTPTISVGKKTPNNVRCPVCLAHTKENCSQAFRNCTGDEKSCAEYVVTIDNERTIIMGCASENFCHTASGQKIENGKVITVSAKCFRSGGSHLRYLSLFLMILPLCSMVSVVLLTV